MTIRVRVYQPIRVVQNETESGRVFFTKPQRMSGDVPKRKIIPKVLEVPFSHSDTISTILDRCF